MRWINETEDGVSWAPTIMEGSQILLLRRRVKKPDREGGTVYTSFDTFEFTPADALDFCDELRRAARRAQREDI